MKNSIHRSLWTGLALALTCLMVRGPAAQLPSSTRPPTPSTPLVEEHILPAGTIVLWSGPLSQVPDGWRLCDGTAGTPDLTERFVLGALPRGEAGEVGGSNRMSLEPGNLPVHDHAVWTSQDGAHGHTYPDRTTQLASLFVSGTYQDQVAFGPPLAWPTQSSLEGSHGHAGQALAVGGGVSLDNRPAYARLAFLQKDLSFEGQGIPLGAILLWSDPVKQLPPGYSVCDGTNGTPDLNGRLIQSVSKREHPGALGGDDLGNLSLANLPAHDHAFVAQPAGEHDHVVQDYYNTLGFAAGLGGFVQTMVVQDYAVWPSVTLPEGEHGHSAWTDPVGDGVAIDKRPAFVTQTFVMRTGPGALAPAPERGIILWAGKRADIPTGYGICNGLEGRPDLRDRFVLGSAQPGDVGGSHELQLSTSNLPSHDHPTSLDPGGAHTHAFGDQHGMGGMVPTGGLMVYYDLAQAVLVVNHHETSTEGEHSHAGQTEPAGFGEPLDNRPAYYRVLFLIKE